MKLYGGSALFQQQNLRNMCWEIVCNTFIRYLILIWILQLSISFRNIGSSKSDKTTKRIIQYTVSWVTICAWKQFCKKDWGSQKPPEKCLHGLLTPPFYFLRRRKIKKVCIKKLHSCFCPRPDSNSRTLQNNKVW